ncbi:XI-2 [Symbiodinium natans]|uniref:XI-2 protein n=1 Tax=Symbiodinium natans TaxID=878477 RepID=A0A812LDY4_9DINO|nr:XI-2 [Symbiodinium natans]
MSNQYAQGTLIWVKHEEEVWIQAEIVTSNEKEIIVKTAEDPNGRLVLGPNEPIFLRTSDVFTSEGLSVLDDLTQLTHLHEPAVLSSLQNRFDIDKIYTFTGPILIALNPFKFVPGLYDEEILKSFITTKPSTKPHVFNTSNASYRGICDRHKSQTVLISGESGAGKTETTKFVMKFLALAGSADGQVTDVEKQVLESNPLLEAFGNARTLRNDNSSRFGKFIELQFRPSQDSGVKGAVQGMSGESLRLCGARIRHYLLEKVRVCEQQEGERNYHIFYEACAAAAKLGGGKVYRYPQMLSKEKVVEEADIDLEGFSELSNFAFLTRSSCKTLKDVDDVEMFERRIHAMQTIGIKKDDLSEILHMIAAVLNLGNSKFDAPPNNSEGSMIMAECANNLAAAEKLLGIQSGDLEKALCHQTRVTRSEKIRSPVNVRQAADNRDALAKALYGIVFNFIVHSTNLSIGYINDVKLFVGVLDIFGFECFKMNSFEQLCINFTNERLQQFFNSFVFKLEEQLYERENIPWDALDFPDNQDSVDLLAGKGTGVFAMLDEECLVPNGSDQGYCNKLIKQHKGHRRFDEIKTKPTWFVIKHFAGPVSYCTDSFLDKNRDQLSNDLIECVGNSSNQFVANLFRKDPKFAEAFSKEEDQPKGGKKKKYTVSSEFKEQLSSLMDVVDLTEPHFIRCIKPNPQNLPDLFDRKGVTEQLRYGGVLQVVQVSRAGYPVRINHQECWDDYKVVGSPKVVSELRHLQDPKIRAQKLLEHLDAELNIPKPKHGLSWAVGKTLVFFKLPAYERVKFARLELLIKSTTLIQASWRGKVRRRMFVAIRLFTRHVQALLRSKQARADLQRRRSEDCATKLQAHARAKLARTRYQNIMRKVIKIQAVRRGVIGRRYAKEHKRHVSAARLQSLVRTRKEQRIYDALRQSVVFAQQRLRMRNAKGQLKKLKQEAKEVGAMMAKAQKAQEQASELRKHNEEMEAHQLQLQSENKTLSNKVKHLEEMLQQMQQQFEEMKIQAAEAAKLAADQSKTVVEAEKMEGLNSQLSQRDEELAGLRKELQDMKENHSKQQESLKAAEVRIYPVIKVLRHLRHAVQHAGTGTFSSSWQSSQADCFHFSFKRENFLCAVSVGLIEATGPLGEGLSSSGTTMPGPRMSLSRVEHTLRLLNALKTPSPPVQRSLDESAGKLSVVFPRWLIIVNVFAMILVALAEGILQPASMSGNPGLQHPRWAAYATLLSLIFCLTELLNGVRASFVFCGYLVILALLGLLSYRDIVSGFARIGPWLPQLQLVIIRGISDSGIMEFSLLWMLGRHPQKGTSARLRLYIATLCLGAIVGATATIATATPVIIQWAKCHDFKVRPLLLMMVVAATCGNSVFVTSSPSSIAIRDVMCEARTCSLKLNSQTPLALLSASVLGLYAMFVGDMLSKRDSIKPEEVRHRTGYSVPNLLRPTPSQPSVEREDVADSSHPSCDLERWPYELDFVVVTGSMVCGHTLRSAGFMNSKDVLIQRISRIQSMADDSSLELVSHSTSELDLDDWCLDVDDVITARCSAAGVCTMRRYPGIFAMRGLHCHQILGGRRHERRLYESVVSPGSELIGKSVEELLGLHELSARSTTESVVPWSVRMFRGYPLAAWRREEEAAGFRSRPLCAHGDSLQAGDVILFDAFQEFPKLQTTQRNFLVSGLVPNSQAPRHGRSRDMWRGVLAIIAFIVALLLDLWQRINILVGCMFIVAMLLMSSAVKPNDIPEILDWNSCLTVGCGEAIFIAIRRSGLLTALAGLIAQIGAIGGSPLQLCTLSLAAQLAAASISPTPAGLLIANAATVLDEKHQQLDSQQLVILIMISCNMVLNIRMPDDLMRGKKRSFSDLLKSAFAICSSGNFRLPPWLWCSQCYGHLCSMELDRQVLLVSTSMRGSLARPSNARKLRVLGRGVADLAYRGRGIGHWQNYDVGGAYTGAEADLAVLDVKIGGRTLKFLDCSGNDRAAHLVKEWFARTQWVFVVYSLTDKRSYEKALSLVGEARQAGASVVLFANKFDINQGKPVEVNLQDAVDKGTQLGAYVGEGVSLSEWARFAASQDETQAPAEDAPPDGAASDDPQKRSSISAAIDSVKSWFGTTPEKGGKAAGVLRASLKGTKAMKQAKRDVDPNADLKPVQELQDSESAVTCVCFGQERLHRAYILFVTASKDGTVVVYRCYRTEMEIAMLAAEDFRGDNAAPPPDHSNIAVHSRLVGHSRAITSVFFNLLEDQLVTTSIDKSVRFWNVDTGEMLKVFTDSSPVPVAAFLPFNPQVFVAANSNAVLRLVNVQNGMVLQKLKVETEVRTLKFDDTGLFLLAGTKSGSIHVLEATDASTLKFKFKVQLARGGVTCLVFVPAAHGQPPCLLVNTSDSSASIIDCTYGPPPGVLTNLAVRHRVRVAHALLPLKCCYSPSSQGYLISASEDKEVYIYSLAKGANYKMSYLKHHQVPVVAVATNHQDTLLASADSLGRVVLWRRMDFSHLPD